MAKKTTWVVKMKNGASAEVVAESMAVNGSGVLTGSVETKSPAPYAPVFAASADSWLCFFDPAAVTWTDPDDDDLDDLDDEEDDDEDEDEDA